MFWATPPQAPPPVQLFMVESAAAETAEVPISPFNRGQWSVDLSSSYTLPAYGDRHRFVTGNLGVAYALLNHFTVSVEIDGYYLRQPGTDGEGGGFNLRGRLELFRFHEASLFVDGSAGLIDSDHPVPDDGTRFNFCESAGIGLVLPVVRPNVFFEGGVRFEHISNAGISRNPGYEGLQAYAGVLVAI